MFQISASAATVRQQIVVSNFCSYFDELCRGRTVAGGDSRLVAQSGTDVGRRRVGSCARRASPSSWTLMVRCGGRTVNAMFSRLLVFIELLIVDWFVFIELFIITFHAFIWHSLHVTVSVGILFFRL